MHISFIVHGSSSVLQFYYIKIRHRFVSNHSKCLVAFVQETRQNLKTHLSENFRVDETEYRSDAYDCSTFELKFAQKCNIMKEIRIQYIT